MLAATLGSFAGGGGGSQAAEDGASKAQWLASSGVGGVAAVCAVLGWFAALALGRMPLGLRNLGAYGLGYTAQAYAYVLLLTDRYPNSDPEAIGRAWELPPHTVRLELDDDGRRSRLTVFFRLLLAIPHFVWLALWTIAAFLAAIANWLRRARPRPLGGGAAPVPRRLRPLLRAHVTAFVTLVANPFPGFAGSPGYPVDIALDPPERQNRWITLFRIFLAIPASVHRRARSASCSFVIALLGWFAALATGRMPTGLRNLGAFAVRYLSQTNAYWLIVTDDYPHASPALRPPPEPEPEYSEYVPPSRSSRRRSDEPARGGASSRRCSCSPGLWVVAAWSLWQSVVPDDLDLGHGSLAGIPPDILERADRYELFFRVEFVVSQLVLLGVLVALRQVRDPLREGVGGRPDRHGDAARDDRARARLDLAGPVPPGGGLVGPPLRPDRQRLHRDALRELVRARRGVPVHLLRARRRDGARGTVPAPLVARRRAVLRRRSRSSSASSIRT